MKNTLLAFGILMGVCEVNLAQAQKYSRVKVYADGKGLQTLSAAGVCIDHGDFKKNTFFISDFSEKEIGIIKSKGYKYEVQIDDVQQHYLDQNNPSNSKYVPLPSEMTHGCNSVIGYATPTNFNLGSMGGFFTYSEVMAHLDNMATKYPNLVKAKTAISATNSIEGRPIYWMKISDNPNVDETEPEMLYDAVHHAREPASVAQLIMYMYYLLENYNTDPEAKYLVDNLEMYFVPLVNPDGYFHNETNNPGGGGMWRKNRKDNQDGTYGIDLNRNYGYNWGFDDQGSSPNSSSDVYRGPAAFSEPETQNMRAFCNAHQFKITLNYHTYGNLLIYPWGYQASLYTPDSAQFVEYAKYLTFQNHYNFGTSNQTVEYQVNGGSDDWMYGEQSSKPKTISMTPEAGDAANGFWPPQNLIISICKENIGQNLHAAHLLLKHAITTDEEPRYISQATGYFNYKIKSLGMSYPATFTVSIAPVSSVITSVGSSKVYSNLTMMQEASDSIAFTISGALQGQAIEYIISVNNGLYTHSDTIEKVFGTPTIIFSSTGNSMTGWTGSTGWGVDNSVFYSSPSSISDSPGGNYAGNDFTSVRTTTAMSLSNALSATLSFRARWEVEPRYDYVEVQASSNGGTSWTPLCGKYTKAGNAYQDDQQPIYDGFMFPWVREEISLDNYVNQNILIRFMLQSDNGNEYDGFFFDDLKVEKILNTNNINEQGGELQFSVFPNPTNGEMQLAVGSRQLAKISITDVLGNIVKALEVNQAATIDLAGNPKGIYFIKVSDEKGNFGVKKIVLE